MTPISVSQRLFSRLVLPRLVWLKRHLQERETGEWVFLSFLSSGTVTVKTKSWMRGWVGDPDRLQSYLEYVPG